MMLIIDTIVWPYSLNFRAWNMTIKNKMYNHWKGDDKKSLFADDMIYIFTQKSQANKLKRYLN